jgi:acetylornithine deacetylase/succinyl-diaminopimelate desuccinylase-like protein
MATLSSVRLLQDLIRFNTTSPPGNEAECITYVNNLLSNAGFETQIRARDSRRPNLVTRLAGAGSAPALLLYGHVDVVPTEGQVWQHPPFEGKLVDGYVWGRGTLDMKGGVAMMISAMLRAKTERLSPAGDVVLAVLSDEERLGDFGAKYMVENHAHLFEGIRYGIGEFGGFSFYIGRRRFYPIQVSEKQLCVVKVTIRGQGGHASVRQPGNVMDQLGRLLTSLEHYRAPVHVTVPARHMVEGIASGLSFPSNVVLRQLLTPTLTDTVLRLLGAKGLALEPTFRTMFTTRAVMGIDDPGEVALEIVGFLLPGRKPDDMVKELRLAIGDKVGVEVIRFDPGPPEPDMGLFGTLADILREADADGVPVPYLVSALTDGRFFGRLGIQSYGFTPMRLGEDLKLWELVHGANERIPADAVDFGASMIYKLLQRFHQIQSRDEVGGAVRVTGVEKARNHE